MKTHDSPERQPIWPWALLVLVTVLGLAGFVLFLFNRDYQVPASWGAAGGPRNTFGDLLNAIQQGIVTPLVAGIFGVLIILKQPRHRIGWLLIATAFITSLSVLMAEWAARGAFSPAENIPGASLAAWITNWIWILLISSVLLMIALFPNGNFLSRPWRVAYTVSALLFLVPGMLAATIEDPMGSAFQIENPFISADTSALYNILFPIAIVFMAVTTVVVLAGTIARYRQSQGDERKKIKWLLAGVALFAFMVLIGFFLVADTFILPSAQIDSSASIRGAIGAFVINAAFVSILLGIGIAMVRHQLYDIDILIRRTTSYAVLTGLLALIYFLSVVILQLILTPLTGRSTPAVVLSTLLIASLFLPVRRRVQELIDRRFFRRKYDAQQTLERFAATVRDETDLDALTAELLRVIEETMQPEHASIWLKTTADRRPLTVDRQRNKRGDLRYLWDSSLKN